MNKKELIVVSVILSIVVSAVTSYSILLLSKEKSKVYPDVIPEYFGAERHEEFEDYYWQQVAEAGLEMEDLHVYLSPDDPDIVLNWYYFEMSGRGWELVDQHRLVWPDFVEKHLLFRREDRGMIVSELPSEPWRLVVGINNWSSIQEFWARIAGSL